MRTGNVSSALLNIWRNFAQTVNVMVIAIRTYKDSSESENLAGS
jgi:hypothetical protein